MNLQILQRNTLYWKYLDIKADSDKNLPYRTTTTVEFLAAIKYIIDSKKSTIQDLCSICYHRLPRDFGLDSHHNSDAIVLKNCTHIFHTACVRKSFYVYRLNSCPLCRAEIKYDDLLINKKVKKKLVEKIKNKIESSDNRLEEYARYNVFFTKNKVPINVSTLFINTNHHKLTDVENYNRIYDDPDTVHMFTDFDIILSCFTDVLRQKISEYPGYINQISASKEVLIIHKSSGSKILIYDA